MNSIDTIIKELPEILEKLKDETLEDPLLQELIDTQSVKYSINEQTNILESIFLQYLQKKQDSTFENEIENICWSFYKDVDIPFMVIYKILTKLKSNMIEHTLYTLKNNTDEIFKIETFIENLINLIAKVYIKKNVFKLSDIYASKFDNYLLFRSHIQWIEDIITSIKTNDLKIFPLQNHQNCKFSHYLEYPESLMVCMDANLCSTLHDLHQLLHKNANTFYLFYQKQQFYQAYIILQEFINNVINFKKVVTELYFLSFSNLEENFYKLIELLLYHKNTLFLTIIDFRKLRMLNTTHGESNINILLKEIDLKFQNIVQNQEENTLLIKATTANYYMLSVDISNQKIEQLNQTLYNISNRCYTINNKEIEIETTIVTLALDNFIEKRRDELTKIMLYLKNTYRQHSDSYYVKNFNEIEKLKQWVEASYKNMDYIERKLQNKEVEVVFQPLYNVQTGKVKVLEALARIKEKEKLIPAGVFIDTLYVMNKIEILDQLILEKLIEKKERIVQVADTLFVNVSYRSLIDMKYKKTLEKFLKTFVGHDVIFELTEQNLVENIEKIQELHDKYNIKFAVDDFGTGYSSLKTVADLSDKDVLQVLKMDGGIVRSIDTKKSTKKIMQTIATLAKELGLCSVAEFVESEEVLKKLKQMGVTYAQGYLLSKPHTIEELLIKKLNESIDYKNKKGII